MNKMKKIWQDNKVLLVLGIILIVCLAVLAVVAVVYFYGNDYERKGAGTKVEERLKNDIVERIEASEMVSNATIRNKDLTVFIRISFVAGTDIKAAEKVAEDSLALFNDDELALYDISYTVKCNDGKFIAMGNRNSSGSGYILWDEHVENSEEVEEEE